MVTKYSYILNKTENLNKENFLKFIDRKINQNRIKSYDDYISISLMLKKSEFIELDETIISLKKPTLKILIFDIIRNLLEFESIRVNTNTSTYRVSFRLARLKEDNKLGKYLVNSVKYIIDNYQWFNNDIKNDLITALKDEEKSIYNYINNYDITLLVDGFNEFETYEYPKIRSRRKKLNRINKK